MKEHELATKNESATKPAQDEVAKKAYAIYLKEGRPQGHDVQNWLEAETKMPHSGHDDHAHMAEDFRKRFWISLILTLPILVLSPMLQTLVGLREAIHFPGDAYLLFALSSAVFWYGGWPFLKGVFEEIKSRQPGMMMFISVAITTAYVYSSAVVFGLAGKMFFWELASLIERLRGFGMILTGVDDHPEHAPKGVRGYGHDELKVAAAEADYLVLAIPGTKENENMIDGTVLAGMKKNAVLVNVARGTLVDEPALLAEVKSGHLYGAGLDVVKDEPVSEGNPLLMEPRIFVTPHIAGSTDLMLDGAASYLGEVLAKYRDGFQSEGIVNEPRKPRVPLRESPTESISVNHADSALLISG